MEAAKPENALKDDDSAMIVKEKINLKDEASPADCAALPEELTETTEAFALMNGMPNLPFGMMPAP